MRKFLCKIGWHKWVYVSQMELRFNLTILDKRSCSCCGLRQEKPLVTLMGWRNLN